MTPAKAGVSGPKINGRGPDPVIIWWSRFLPPRTKIIESPKQTKKVTAKAASGMSIFRFLPD
jgi:hypothetical protein